MTRQSTLFSFLLAVLVLVLTIFAISFNAQPKGQVMADVSPEAKVCFREHCFRVELAKTPVEQARGLMFREHLDEGNGMLFVYENEAVRTFWMKNTYIPLDIIWLDSDRKVIQIKRNAQPCDSNTCPTIGSKVKSRYVLEFNGGIAEKIELKTGDVFEF